MTNAELRKMLMKDLGITTDFMDAGHIADTYEEMDFFLGAAREYIAREGVTLENDNLSHGDAMLVVKYASFLYSGGDTTKLPPMIRKPLNDRIYQEHLTRRW